MCGGGGGGGEEVPLFETEPLTSFSNLQGGRLSNQYVTISIGAVSLTHPFLTTLH